MEFSSGEGRRQTVTVTANAKEIRCWKISDFPPHPTDTDIDIGTGLSLVGGSWFLPVGIQYQLLTIGTFPPTFTSSSLLL